MLILRQNQEVRLVRKFLNSPFFVTLGKLLMILTAREKAIFYKIVVLTTFGVLLEMFSVVMILPIMGQLTGNPVSVKLAIFQSAINYVHQLSPEKALIIEILLLIVIVLIKNAYLAWLAYEQSSFGHRVQSRISSQLFKNYLYQPFHYHTHHNSSLLIRNCIHEANQFNQFVILPSFTIISETFLIVGLSLLLVFFQPYFTLINGTLLGVSFLLFNRITGKKILDWGHKKLASEGKRIQLIQQGLGAIKEVKLRQSEGYFLNIYDVYNKESAHTGHLYNALQQMPRLFLEILLYAGLLLLVILTIITESNVANLVTALGLFAAAVYKLMPSANKVSTSYQSMKISMPSMDNFIAELNLEGTSSRSEADKGSIFELKSTLELNDISFYYSSDKVGILQQVSLTINKGDCIGFFGESGSGKSTLINIILGLLPPQNGTISIDGVDIRQDMPGWQKNIGYVSQNIYLIDDSIRRNIAFGLPDDLIDDRAVFSAIQKAQLNEFIESLPNGLDTFTGERGVRLSGGQIQRIGIARALYHNPEVLVLDEATSALDYSTESGIMDAIENLHGTKTIIIVAHRLSTLDKCDRLYKLDDGKLTLEKN